MNKLASKEDKITSKRLFITGMFRSGTTLLARALNAHENISFASDPFFEFFKYIRGQYYVKKYKNFDMDQPLSDKFLEDSQFNSKFTSDFLGIKLGQEDSKIFLERIFQATQAFSPAIIPLLKKIKIGKERKVENILNDLVELIMEAYPKRNMEVVGFKEVWLEEFIDPLLQIPGFYSLQIIRDPRAIMASNKRSSGGKYPILFLIRHWRKSVAYSMINQVNKRYFRVKFEDLIEEPEKSFRTICQFLKIKYSPNLVDFNKFKNGQGEQWYQNSSYSSFKKSKEFNQKTIDKWKKNLSSNEIKMIELLCKPEMKYLGYELSSTEFNCKMLLDYKDDEEKFADWIKQYNFKLDNEKMEQEIVRIFLLKNPRIEWGTHILEKFFISRIVYDKLKEFTDQ